MKIGGEGEKKDKLLHDPEELLQDLKRCLRRIDSDYTNE